MVKELYSLPDRVLARISKFADEHKFEEVLKWIELQLRNLKKGFQLNL